MNHELNRVLDFGKQTLRLIEGLKNIESQFWGNHGDNVGVFDGETRTPIDFNPDIEAIRQRKRRDILRSINLMNAIKLITEAKNYQLIPGANFELYKQELTKGISDLLADIENKIGASVKKLTNQRLDEILHINTRDLTDGIVYEFLYLKYMSINSEFKIAFEKQGQVTDIEELFKKGKFQLLQEFEEAYRTTFDDWKDKSKRTPVTECAGFVEALSNQNFFNEDKLLENKDRNLRPAKLLALNRYHVDIKNAIASSDDKTGKRRPHLNKWSERLRKFKEEGKAI